MYKYVILIASLAFSIIAILNFKNGDLKNSLISVVLAVVCLFISKNLNK